MTEPRTLPLPDDQPVAVNALRNKRSRLAGEIAIHTREIERLRVEIIHLDSVLRLFDPAVEPSDLPAIEGRRRTEWFARGEVTRRVYEVLRDEGFIVPRVLALALMAEKNIDKLDRQTREDIVNRVANVCHDLARRKKLVKVGRGREARWKLPDPAADCARDDDNLSLASLFLGKPAVYTISFPVLGLPMAAGIHAVDVHFAGQLRRIRVLNLGAQRFAQLMGEHESRFVLAIQVAAQLQRGMALGSIDEDGDG